jgi:GR25 family glycosyltransferase involved in LPS biosynthesis
MNKFFDKIYLINLDKRTDRWVDSVNECIKMGIKGVERFKAFEGENRCRAFNRSQYECLKKALADGCEKFLILEDDIEFRNWQHVEQAMSELPGNWSGVWLGGNLIGLDTFKFREPLPYSKHLRVLVDSWQTHAIGYTRALAEWIVENFPYWKEEYEKEGLIIYDEWLRVNVLPKFMCFVVNPQVAVQRKSFSDLWQCEADYSSCFERGNELMQY